MSKKINVHLLVNEVAGNGNAIKANTELHTVLNKLNIPFDQQKSNYPGELTKLACEYANNNPAKNNILIVIGGDGSFNEVLNGIKQSHYPETPITYFSAGTGNDFARGAGLTDDPFQLINNLLQDPEPEKVDCGYFTSNIAEMPSGYFVNNFGIGFDAFVVHQSNHTSLKKKLNHINSGNLIYGLNVVKALINQKTFAVTVKTADQTLRYGDAYLVTTTNHPYFGGGFAILPKADIYSHHLDTVIVEKPNLNRTLFLFGKLITNGSHVTAPEFHYVEAKEIQVETKKPEYAQIDGEDVDKQNFKVNFKINHFNLLK